MNCGHYTAEKTDLAKHDSSTELLSGVCGSQEQKTEYAKLYTLIMLGY